MVHLIISKKSFGMFTQSLNHTTLNQIPLFLFLVLSLLLSLSNREDDTLLKY